MLDVSVETRDLEHSHAVERALAAAGFTVTRA
jgi:hypothetical protein